MAVAVPSYHASATSSRTAASPAWRHALALIAGASCVRLLVAAQFPLVADEAYYWEWSRRLAAGYFDHPPMVALLTRIGTLLFGDTPLGVRFGHIVAGALASIAVALLARRFGGDRAARRAAVLLAVIPLSGAGFLLATPDAGLVAAASWTLVFVVRALDAAPQSAEALRAWLAAGVALGLTMVAKYTGVLLPLGVTAALLLHPRLRARFLEPGPWLAVLVSLLVFAPVVWWNATHDWVSFRFQLAHGLEPHEFGLDDILLREGNLWGAQLLLVTPVLLVLMCVATVRALRGRDPQAFTLAVTAWVPVAFFTYSASRAPAEANWLAPAYLPATALLAAATTGRAMRAWLVGGGALALLLLGVVYAHALSPSVPIGVRNDPVTRAFGWDTVREAADRAASRATTVSATPPRRAFIAANRYQDAALLAFHGSGDPVPSLNILSRRNQYDAWPGFADRAAPGDALVLLVDDSPAGGEVVGMLRPHFDAYSRGPRVPIARAGRETDARVIWTFTGWRGTWPSRSDLLLLRPQR